MASFCLKIRHVFGFISMTERSIGAGPPVIIQLSGSNQLSYRGRAVATGGGGGGNTTNNCSWAISGWFPIDFQLNSGNSQGIKKWTLCSESELELTIDKLKTKVGIKPAAFGIRYQPVLCQLSYEAKYSFLKIEILFIPLLANSHIFEMRPQLLMNFRLHI